MTVHKAKGLEFPVVILADPTCDAARDTPSRQIEPARRLWLEPLSGSAPIELLEAADEELIRNHADAVRVAHAATTRARDLLVVPVCGDQPIEGWLGVLDPMLYPPDEARLRSGPAPCYPMFGDDSVSNAGPRGVLPRTARSGLACIARKLTGRASFGGTRRCSRTKSQSGSSSGISASCRRTRMAPSRRQAKRTIQPGRRHARLCSAGLLARQCPFGPLHL